MSRPARPVVRGKHLRCDLQLSGYSQGFIDSVIRSKGRSRQKKKEEKPLETVYIPYVKGISEKFKRIGNQYNIKTVFKLNTLYNGHLGEQDQKGVQSESRQLQNSTGIF
jgi:hypothetical protein